MLRIPVIISESYDEKTEQFTAAETFVVDLEHSLSSVAEWESCWEKPFVGIEEKTDAEAVSYIRIMILTPDVPESVFKILVAKHTTEIVRYISAKMTATWFSDNPNGPKTREIITAEIIYYWMVSLGIPFECDKWHLNRLITLVRTINAKNAPKKKMTAQDALAERRALNARRLAQNGTTG